MTQLIHPAATGKDNETLSIDYALIEPDAARSMLILTSGTHGVEGFCGSGCQVALLHDRHFLQHLAATKTALLLVHAVNPYGFAYCRRVNEDNIDLNRNLVDFATLQPNDAAYQELDQLLLPQAWPPTAENNAALMHYIATHGARELQSIITRGQYSVADGLFYGGASQAWSLRELAGIFARHASAYERLAWIDIHTGLGNRGYGEKISSTLRADERLRSVSWWGADVKSISGADSVSSEVDGILINLLHQTCPEKETTAIALEFGTQDPVSVLNALRADHWLYRYPQVNEDVRQQIGQHTRNAFYIDADDWRGQVVAQLRLSALQAIAGLSETAIAA